MAIAALIRRTIRISNAADYTPEQVESFAAGFTPENIAVRIRSTYVLAMWLGEEIIGTACLDRGFLRSVYVDPARQGRGFGSQLCDAAEREAGQRELETLDVQSSVTARGVLPTAWLRPREGVRSRWRADHHDEEATGLRAHDDAQSRSAARVRRRTPSSDEEERNSPACRSAEASRLLNRRPVRPRMTPPATARELTGVRCERL